MENIWSWIDDHDESSHNKLVLMGVVTLLVVALSSGAHKYVAAFAGRLHLRKLSSRPQSEAKRDATLSHIFIYPVKSLRATEMAEVTFDNKGLVDDRRFMFVAPRPTPLHGFFAKGEPTHQFITQRQVPTLATVRAELEGASLTLSSPDQQITIPLTAKGGGTRGTTIKARIWDDSTEVVDMGDEAAAFLAKLVSKDQDAPPTAQKVRLVSMKKDDPRMADAKYTPNAALSWKGEPPQVGLTDGFPVLIANEASLEELNRRLVSKGKEKIPMSRFRPNLVVSGAKPFEEDTWKIISINGVLFHLVKGCPRCKQSCTDQETGTVSEEPLATLAEFRALGPIRENVYFAQNAIAQAGGTVRVGAAIHVLERGDPVWDS